MSQVSRTIAKTYFETGDTPTQGQFANLIDSAKWYDESTTANVTAFDELYTYLGRNIKGESLGAHPLMSNGSLTMTDQQIRFSPLKVFATASVTGVKFAQVTAGNYTASNENRIGIYSLDPSTGLLTLVTATASDGTIWQTTTNTFGQRAFPAPWAATMGLYWSAFIYCRSAQVTAPGVGAGPTSVYASVMETGFTGSNKVCMLLNGQTSLPPSVNMSALTRAGASLYIQLY